MISEDADGNGAAADRAMSRTLALLVAGLVALYPGAARAAQPVDLELALAVDVSGSIDDEEAQLQRDGYVAAFQDPAVIRAIEHGMLGRIAVAYYEWAGFDRVRVIVDWTLVSGAASARAFAGLLTLEPPRTVRRTSISSAIDFGVPYFERNDFDGTRRVIDVSAPLRPASPSTACRSSTGGPVRSAGRRSRISTCTTATA